MSDGRCGSIGYGIATAYAKEGANLVITGRNASKLNKAKEELEHLYNIKVLPIVADISEKSDNEALSISNKTNIKKINYNFIFRKDYHEQNKKHNKKDIQKNRNRYFT